MLTIEELSQKVGCHIETCRYYEKLGFFQGSGDAGAQILYDDTHKHRLMFILKLRHLGFNLEQMSGLLTFYYTKNNSFSETSSAADFYLRLISEKISALQSMKETIAEIAATKNESEEIQHSTFRLAIINSFITKK